MLSIGAVQNIISSCVLVYVSVYERESLWSACRTQRKRWKHAYAKMQEIFPYLRELRIRFKHKFRIRVECLVFNSKGSIRFINNECAVLPLCQRRGRYSALNRQTLKRIGPYVKKKVLEKKIT